MPVFDVRKTMETVVKHFDSLTTRELLEILRIRNAVFVVEQNCVYQDIDGHDEESHHIFIKENDEIKAYLRIFDAGEGWAKIGRVIAVERGTGLGAKVVKAGIDACRNILGRDKIYLEAQCYAIGFYQKCGLAVAGEEFLEDGIPHVRMEVI